MKLYNPFGLKSPTHVVGLALFIILAAVAILLTVSPVFTVVSIAIIAVVRVLYYIFRGR